MENSRKLYIKDAERLGDYQSLSKTELANGLCQAEDDIEMLKNQLKDLELNSKEALDVQYKLRMTELTRSAYFSALMLRYWYKIYEYKTSSSSLQLDDTDYVAWLTKGLWVAFYYKTWWYEYKAEVKEGKFIAWKYDEQGNKIPNPLYWKVDRNAPDKVINRCCYSIRGREYQYYNHYIRKAGIQTYSLDSMQEDGGDGALVYGNCITSPELNSVNGLISLLVNKGEFLEALIADGIANYDSYKDIKTTSKSIITSEDGEEEVAKTTTYSTEFDKRKLARHLESIDSDFISHFCDKYKVEPVYKENISTQLLSLTKNRFKLYNKIKKTLMEIASNPDLLSFLIDE